ncbi:MAG: hypothetical protein ACR2HG_14990 [Pyrinomonadaceae bacterium]
MKRRVIFMAIFSLFLAVAAVSAQEKTTDYSGNWELDVSKSKLGDRLRIESMTMNVSQTDKELKVESTVKRAARPEGDTNGGGMNRGGGMGRGDGTQTVTYSLDGKETKAATGGQMGGEATLKAKVEKDGKLKLTSSRTFSGQMGEMTITTKETWELTDGGKTLKVTRDTETPRGSQSAEMVFNKK